MDPTNVMGILALISLFGFPLGLVITRSGNALGHLLVGVSAIGLLFFGSGWAAISFSEHNSQVFNEKRDLIAPLMHVRLDRVCDRLGVVEEAEGRPNCVERNGLRLWRDSGRLYVASIYGKDVFTDLIVDEDGLMGGYYDSIIHLSKDLDLRRLAALTRADS